MGMLVIKFNEVDQHIGAGDLHGLGWNGHCNENVKMEAIDVQKGTPKRLEGSASTEVVRLKGGGLVIKSPTYECSVS